MSTNVHKKLMQARIQLQAQPVKKSGKNTFANYSYMELGDFLNPTQSIFANLGLCGVVSFTADVASLTITDTEDGSQIVITSPMGSAALKGCHEVQNVGAVETYQRRYLWVTAMEIVEHDALDSSEPDDSLVPVLKASLKESTRTTVMKVRRAIQEHLANGREMGALGEWQGLKRLSNGEEVAHGVWAGLTTPERDEITRMQNEAQAMATASPSSMKKESAPA